MKEDLAISGKQDRQIYYHIENQAGIWKYQLLH